MPSLYVIRTPSGLRKIGHSTTPKRRAGELRAHNTINERGEFVLEYERECSGSIVDAEMHAHSLVREYAVAPEYFRIDLEAARAAVDAAVDAMPLVAAPKAEKENLTRITIYCAPELVVAVNAWRRKQTPIPSVNEALHCLIGGVLERSA